jgi:hypothetical protein
VCFENQRDFNYLDLETLAEADEIAADHVRIKGMRYSLLVIDGLHAPLPAELLKRLRPMIDAGHVVAWTGSSENGIRAVDAEGLLRACDTCCPRDVQLLPPAPAVRVRHLVKDGHHFYLLFNETGQPVRTAMSKGAAGKAAWVDTVSAKRTEVAEDPIPLDLGPYGVALLHVSP